MNRLITFILALALALPGPIFRDTQTLTSTVIITLEEGSDKPDILNNHTTITYEDEDFIILDFTGSCTEFNAYLSRVSNTDGVLYAEVDTRGTICSLTDDYFSDTQYWLDNPGSYIRHSAIGTEAIESTADIDIDAPEGWAAYNTLSPTRTAVIAVIDTGIDYTHPDLASSMWINSGEIPDNGIDDDGNGFIDDIYGWDFYNNDASICHYEYSKAHDAYLYSPLDNDNHGTHCAGIIAAAANNQIGIAGITGNAPVKLMSLKVYGGADYTGSIADCIKAIRYAEVMGADICNVSWGFYTYSSSLYTAMERSGMLFVCAAGNDGFDNDATPLYPASFNLSNIISVTYLDKDGVLDSKANFGSISVDVAVPATDIFSTVVGSYASMSGSSMAAPQVSAIASLLYTLGDGMYASNVRDIILSGTKNCSASEANMISRGIPSLAAILSNSSEIIYDTIAPDALVTLTYNTGELVLDFTPTDRGGSGVSNLRYFTGRRKNSYFENGTAGTAISGNRLTLSKGGTYTVYVSDYSGNESIKLLRIIDDLVSPIIDNIDITSNNKMTKLTVSANVSDRQSGLKNVRYLKGVHSPSDFKKGDANELETDSDGDIKFTVTEEGTYTVCATDLRGNSTIAYVYAYIRRASSITFTEGFYELPVGEAVALDAVVYPAASTDRINYTSSDEAIASVSARGRVTALAPGECVITATTSSGKAAECHIVVPAGN